jgi:hypothetical protein
MSVKPIARSNRDRFLNVFGGLVAILVFRLYLLPNTIPGWVDAWRDIQTYHFGLHSLSVAAVAVCLLAAIVFGSYYPPVSRSNPLFVLWLAVGGWLALTVITICVSMGQPQLVQREANLLLGYTAGLAAARLFRRLDRYIVALIACGALQSIIAIWYYSKGIHPFLSGTVIRAGGTFGTPSELYLLPLFILPLAVQGVLSSTRTFPSVFYMLCAGSMFAALVLTWERSGFAAVLAGLFWLARKYVSARNQVVCLAIVFLLLCGGFFVRSNGPVNSTSSMHSIRSRAYLFEAGALTFSRHWLNGVGVGRLSLPVPVTIHEHTEYVQMLDPYNQFLYWLDEMGIFGGVLIALLVVSIYKVVSDLPSLTAHGIAAVWVSVLLAGLFNTLFGWNDFSCGNMLIGSLLGITMRLGSVNEISAPVGVLLMNEPRGDSRRQSVLRT